MTRTRFSAVLRAAAMPCLCFALSWGVAHWGKALLTPDLPPAVRQPSVTASASLPLPKNPPGRGGVPFSSTERLRALREALATRPPAEWSGLWSAFAAIASRRDLESLAREPQTLPARLAQEELAIRTGKALGPPGAFAALADHDPEAAWQQVRTMGQSEATGAVLRILAMRDPGKALQLWREMPLRPAPRPLTADEGMERGRVAVMHTALGSLFASWARKDPAGAEAAVDSLPVAQQRDARREIAMAWALHDGPAALQYFAKYAEPSGMTFWRVDLVLLSSFDHWPRETALLLKQNPLLGTATLDWISPWAVPGLWFLADPDTCLQTLLREGNPSPLFYCKAVTQHPEAAARLLRNVPPDPENPGRAEKVITEIALRNPESGLELAKEFNLLPAAESALRQSNVTADPAAAVETWLQALRAAAADHEGQVPDPAKIQESLGWTGETVKEITAFAKARLPDQSSQLERLLSSPHPTGSPPSKSSRQGGYVMPVR